MCAVWRAVIYAFVRKICSGASFLMECFWEFIKNSLFYQKSKLWKSYLSLWSSPWFWKTLIFFTVKSWFEGWAVLKNWPITCFIFYFQSHLSCWFWLEIWFLFIFLTFKQRIIFYISRNLLKFSKSRISVL
jgi:hypothetical protein